MYWPDSIDIGVNMGKKANVSDNIQQKLSLAVKSGKFKVGKYLSN